MSEITRYGWDCGTCGSAVVAEVRGVEVVIYSACSHPYVPTGSEPWVPKPARAGTLDEFYERLQR